MNRIGRKVKLPGIRESYDYFRTNVLKHFTTHQAIDGSVTFYAESDAAFVGLLTPVAVYRPATKTLTIYAE